MSLVEIEQLPAAENAVITLHVADNIVVARATLPAGFEVRMRERAIKARASIPVGHKMAVRAIRAGDKVIRYGQSIGIAKQAIEAGDWVHTHNVRFEDAPPEYEYPERELPLPEAPRDCPTFRGYLREDGRAGVRNYIAVAAASNCAAHTAELVAASYASQELPPGVDGVVAFPHGEGCGHIPGPDIAQLHRTFAGVLDHPNVSGAVLIGLGCETNQIANYASLNRVAGLTLQSSGGTRAVVEAARREIDRMIERAVAEKRVELPVSKIVLGLNCGGSDSFSGITANPALGVCSDRLVQLAAAVLGETPECFGAEHLLVRRARNREVGERFIRLIEGYKTYLRRFGSTFDDNPSPGNKEGGLTNILEKSLGAAAKAGTAPMTDAVDYAERVRTPGFVFMNTPGYDPVSLTGLAAGGVNLIVFTTGRGSAIGFPTIPVIKVASNSNTYNRMRDNMDINAGRIADGTASLQSVGDEIFEMLLRVASGDRTCAELLGHREFVPWRIGPVM